MSCLSDLVANPIRAFHPKMKPAEMLAATEKLMLSIPTGEHHEGAAYRLLVALRPDLEPTLTNYMYLTGHDWIHNDSQSAVYTYCNPNNNQPLDHQ